MKLEFLDKFFENTQISPDRPARSESVYRLSYTGLHVIHTHTHTHIYTHTQTHTHPHTHTHTDPTHTHTLTEVHINMCPIWDGYGVMTLF